MKYIVGFHKLIALIESENEISFPAKGISKIFVTHAKGGQTTNSWSCKNGK